MSRKKVSILMSAYNAQNSIEKSLNSLIDQTYQEIEILIADDGSTDQTEKICYDYSNNYSNIFLFKNEKNIGLTKSLNLLIKKSKGEYIARQDADDISDTRRIEKQLDYLSKYNLDAVTCRAKTINENRTIPNFSYYLPKKILMYFKNPYIHGTLLIKKNIIEEMNCYNEKFYFAQDYKLMTDLHSAGKKIKIMKEQLYYLNMKDNISSNNYQEQQYFAKCVRKGIEPKF
tara:strand:+ start:2246 stop:2935 length:690 start_codon:yes stop_codon:yes gene_type:complete